MADYPVQVSFLISVSPFFLMTFKKSKNAQGKPYASDFSLCDCFCYLIDNIDLFNDFIIYELLQFVNLLEKRQRKKTPHVARSL